MCNCSNHGECLENQCFCDLGWFTSDCSQSLKDQWQEAYYFYLSFFLFLFFLVGLYSILLLFQQLNLKSQTSYLKGCTFFLYAIKSPLNITITISIFASFVKLVWLSIDPFQINGILHRSYERMIGEFIYSLLYALYSVVLIVWYTIYDEISFILHNTQNRNCICTFFKKFLKLRVFIVIILQLGISYVKGIRKNKEYREISYLGLGLLYINFILFIIEFVLYGKAVYSCINQLLKTNQQYFEEQKQKLLQQLQDLYHNSLSPLDQIQSQKQPDEQISDQIQVQINNLQKSSQSPKSIQLQDNEICSWLQQSNNDSELSKKQLQLVKNLKDQKEQGKLKGSQKKSLQRLDDSKFINEDLKRKNYQERKSNLDVQINQFLISYCQAVFTTKREGFNSDKKVLNKIMLIIVFGVFLEISFAILSVIAETSTLLMTAEGTLVILYSVGILEIVSLLVILQLFSSMSSKELENLRWISKVGTSKNKINQEYEFQMPVDLKASDKTKTMFEERINQC